MSQFFGHFTTIIALWQKVLFQNITNTFINETHIKCSWFALGDIMLFCFPCNKWICRCLSTFKTQKFNKSVSDFFQMPIPFLISINTFIWDTSFSHHGEKETYFSFFAGVITLAAVPVACFLAAGVQFFTTIISTCWDLYGSVQYCCILEQIWILWTYIWFIQYCNEITHFAVFFLNNYIVTYRSSVLTKIR